MKSNERKGNEVPMMVMDGVCTVIVMIIVITVTVGGNDLNSSTLGVNGNTYDSNGNGNDGDSEGIFVTS